MKSCFTTGWGDCTTAMERTSQLWCTHNVPVSDPGAEAPPPLQVNEMHTIHFGQNTSSHFHSILACRHHCMNLSDSIEHEEGQISQKQPIAIQHIISDKVQNATKYLPSKNELARSCKIVQEPCMQDLLGTCTRYVPFLA